MTNSLLILLGLLVLVACLPGVSHSQSILNCTRTTNDYFPGTKGRYDSLSGALLTTNNVLLVHNGPPAGGQVVDGSLHNLTSEFAITNPYQSQLVAGPDGEFGVLSPLNNQILLQPYTATGQPIGDALVVAQSTVQLQFTVAHLQDANKVVVVWKDSNTSALYARLYNHWVPTDAFVVAPVTTQLSSFQIDSLTTGGFVVSWLDGSVLKVQTFDSDADALSAAPTVVSQTATFFATEPHLGGRFIIGWASNSDLTSNSNTGNYIYGQIFNKRGSAVSAPFLIRTRFAAGHTDDDGNFGLNPVSSLSFVVFQSTGRFIALWIETEGAGYNTQTVLYARNFLASGVSTNTKERPILYHAIQYTATSLDNGSWLVFGKWGHRVYQYATKLVLKAFVSINDFDGFETEPLDKEAISSRRYADVLLAKSLWVTSYDASTQTSNLVALWTDSTSFGSDAAAFGIQCTISQLSNCYDNFEPTSAEQLENTGRVAQDQIHPVIAVYPKTSTHTVVWQTENTTVGPNYDMAARWYEGYPEVQLNFARSTLNINPSVGMKLTYNYMAVWQRLHVGSNGSSDWDIIGLDGYEDIRYASEMMVNEHTERNQLNASVACSDFGAIRCLVVWQGEEASGNYNIYARFQQTALDPYDPIHYDFPEFRVNTDEGEHKNPKVTFLGDGIHYVITWQYQAPGTNTWTVKYKVSDYFASVNPLAALPGPDLKASTAIVGNELSPVVTSYLYANRFVLAWKAQQGNRIVARLFDMDGPVGKEFTVARVASGPWGYPAVAPFYNGWAVAWQAPDGLWLKAFDGKREQALIQMNDAPVGNDQPWVPSIAGIPFSSVLKAVWQSTQIDGSGYGIVLRTLGC